MQRRDFLQTAFWGASALVLPPLGNNTMLSSSEETWPLPDLKKLFPAKITLDTVELLRTQDQLMLVVRSGDQMGITQCNARMNNLTSLLKGLVLPHFVGMDARDLPQLADNAYRLNSNYKYAGMPLWNCIGSVEIAVWDLLGKMAGKPVYALLGKPVRNDYPIYVSDFNREGDVVGIVANLQKKLDITGANGIKIKIGGRMVNTEADTRQTRALVTTVRKVLGDDLIIYADANSSFSVKDGIEAGKLLEDYGVEIMEEPCNFEDEETTLKINKALKKLLIAGGEQDSSFFRFRRLAKQKIYQILQPDMYYNGGIIRTLNVSVMAQTYGAKGLAPHSPKADPLIGPFWQVAALAPNLYGLQEFVLGLTDKHPGWYTKVTVENGRIRISDRPGLGIEYDAGIWKNAEKVV